MVKQTSRHANPHLDTILNDLSNKVCDDIIDVTMRTISLIESEEAATEILLRAFTTFAMVIGSQFDDLFNGDKQPQKTFSPEASAATMAACFNAALSIGAQYDVVRHRWQYLDAYSKHMGKAMAEFVAALPKGSFD